MANQASNTNNDEVDLGQLFQLIERCFEKLFQVVLRVFLFFKKHALVLLILIAVGAGAGFGLNQILTKKLKTEVIVKPQMESKNYLYDVVAEIQANVKAKNIEFFNGIGIEIDDLKNISIEISAVDDHKENSESDLKYLELLQTFENVDAISEIVRAEFQNKSSFNHRISFFYKNKKTGEAFAKGIITYINSNQYYDDLIGTYRSNAEGRLEKNDRLTAQVDDLLTNYSKRLAENEDFKGNDKIVLDNQERINITGLLNLKNSLIRDSEQKRLELQKMTNPVKVINFGKTQEVQRPLYGQNVVLLPLVLISIYLLICFITFLNKKAEELL